jgi:mannose-1-phosphate guanylyltransferase
MAGGVGSRFWPRSRKKKPKQLLNINSQFSMIQDTIKRLEGLATSDDILIITTQEQKDNLIEQVPFIPQKNIIAEPFGRNTAPCIGLAAIYLEAQHPDAIMSIVCADHTIPNETEFKRVLKLGAETTYKSKSIITIGIVPTRPDTGFGYIQFDNNINKSYESGIFKVKKFTEKPNLEIAEQFLKSGDFLWNSGMFIMRIDVLLEQYKKHLPDLYNALKSLSGKFSNSNFENELEETYKKINSVSIDYGIMEKATDVLVIKGDFGWNDLGSWNAVYLLSAKDENGNATVGEHICINSNNSYIYSPNKLVATIGIDDLIIINSDDALLICKREKSQEVKDVVDILKSKHKDELL